MSSALWLKLRFTRPLRDELRLPLGRWLVVCPRCRGWVIDFSALTSLRRRL